MAFTLSAIKLLAQAHARQPFEGPILTLGRQGVYATLDQCAAAVRSQGIKPQPLDPGLALGPTVPAFKEPPYDHFTNDEVVFRMICGDAPETLDVSDYEQADHIHDLNAPLPEELAGRFGLIIDGGTLEHVFDVAQALRNLKTMLRPGGRIIHICPMSNWAEHGYFQFSPTFFYDWYLTNGFVMEDCFIMGITRSHIEGLYQGRQRIWRWNAGRPPAPIVSGYLLNTFFEARKVSNEDDHIPIQGEGFSGGTSSRLGGGAPRSHRLSAVRNAVLSTVPGAGKIVALGKKLLGRDLTSAPWGGSDLGRM